MVSRKIPHTPCHYPPWEWRATAKAISACLLQTLHCPNDVSTSIWLPKCQTPWVVPALKLVEAPLTRNEGRCILDTLHDMQQEASQARNAATKCIGGTDPAHTQQAPSRRINPAKGVLREQRTVQCDVEHGAVRISPSAITPSAILAPLHTSHSGFGWFHCRSELATCVHGDVIRWRKNMAREAKGGIQRVFKECKTGQKKRAGWTQDVLVPLAVEDVIFQGEEMGFRTPQCL